MSGDSSHGGAGPASEPVAPTRRPAVTAAKSETVFEAVAAAFSSGEVGPARMLFSPGYLDHQRPEGSGLVGPEEFTAVVAGARHGLGELVVRVVSKVTTADDLCVAVLAWHGQDRSGVMIERETVETLRIDHAGKIAEHWGMEVRREHVPR